MPSLADLIRMGKQYVTDALPGGTLNPEGQPVADQARYIGGITDPDNSQLGRDLQTWHRRTQAGLSDQLQGVQSPEADYAYQQLMNMAGAISPARKQAKEVYRANKEIFDNAHKADNLSFQALPIQETSEAVSIYRSPRYGGKAPSEYMVGMVNGEPAYIRKSDHWGKFTTNIKEGSIEAKAAGLGDEVGDQFGRVGFKPHNWELQGGISSQHADRIATAQALRDVLPEAQRFSFIGDRLWDEIYALSKPGKREAGYIPLSRLLESKK